MIVRPTEPSDLPSVSDLFGDRFGHPVSREEWEWKYRRLPGEGRSWVALDRSGRVLAHAGALCLPALLEPEGAAEARIWQLTDWAGTTAAGGLRPPLVDLGRRLLADLPRPGDAPWIFGFPSDRHLRLGRRVFGYRPLPPVEPLAGPLDAAAEGADPSAGLIRPDEHCGGWPEAAEAAWTACGVPSVRRSADFLNWRYHARPGRYYRFYRLEPAPAACSAPDAGEGSGECGLAVFAFIGADAHATELWLPTRTAGAAVWAPALRAVAADLAAAGLERWHAWPPPGAIGELLRALGMRPTGEARIMGCRGRGGRTDGPSPADPAFYYAMGDYDLV